MKLKNKFKIIFDSGKSICFQNTIIRINGEFEMRIVWKHVQLPGNTVLNSCKWEGFTTIEECVDDCLNYLEKID